MAYSELGVIRNNIYTTIVRKISTSNACTVADVLMSPGKPDTHKVIEEAYRSLGQKYDPANVLATKTLDGKGVHFSPAALKIQQLR